MSDSPPPLGSPERRQRIERCQRSLIAAAVDNELSGGAIVDLITQAVIAADPFWHTEPDTYAAVDAADSALARLEAITIDVVMRG